MKFKYYIFLLVFLLFVSRNITIGYAIEPSNTIDVRNINMSWTSGLCNNVRVINFNDGVKYFKECKKKVDKKSAVKRIINEYFDEYLSENFPDDRKLLIESLSGDNFEKFVNAGFLWNKHSNLSKYINGELDSSFLGIPNYIAKKLKIDLKNFFLYASREFANRFISSNIKEGKLQTNLAMRQIATYKLAKWLGIENVVVKTKFVKLVTDYGEKVGILIDRAPGFSESEINKMDLEVNAKFQRELTNLQILDTIIDEQDHDPKNCFFKVADAQLVGVSAFDNEGGFNLSTKLQKGLCWNETSCLVTESGKINLPHVSKSLAEKILNTRDDDIRKILGDLLSDNKVKCVITRLNYLKSALINTISGDDGFLLTDEQWCSDTILQEFSGNYGNTYLVYFLKHLNLKIK